jgi:hypothetical protein
MERLMQSATKLGQALLEQLATIDKKTKWAFIIDNFSNFAFALLECPDLAIQNRQRIRPIDDTRGMLIIWMIIAHALTVAGIDPTDPIEYLRPPGWSTTSFIALSGFTVAAVLIQNQRKGVQSASKLLVRAFKIGIIAFSSNFLFKALSAAFFGGLSTDYILRILIFKEPWSISAFLVPTVFLLLAAPTVIRIAMHVRPWQLLTAATAIGLCFDAYVRIRFAGTTAPMDTLGAFARPFTWVEITYFFMYGLWGFAFGNLLKRKTSPRLAWPAILSIAVLLLILADFHSQIRGTTGEFILPIARFVVTIEIVLVLSRLGTFFGLEQFINTLGQSALLIFVLHRPFLQMGGYVLQRFLPERAVALELISAALLFSFWIATLRKNHRSLSTLLSAMGF